MRFIQCSEIRHPTAVEKLYNIVIMMRISRSVCPGGTTVYSTAIYIPQNTAIYRTSLIWLDSLSCEKRVMITTMRRKAMTLPMIEETSLRTKSAVYP